MTAVVYPGTFDPVTNGHVDLVERAANLFDRVIVAIASSEKKRPLFDLDERTHLCELAIAHIDGVEIMPFSGLLTEFVVELRNPYHAAGRAHSIGLRIRDAARQYESRPEPSL